jgi:AcrR family transcriptional regulator
MTGAAATKPHDLREACVQEALAIIDQSGLEALSLREVARRLGVSHQAPYRHYPSRDHLLAELVRRAFAAFAAHLDARPRHTDPAADLAAMGHAYLDYAARHPLQYRLIFGTPLPPAQDHPGMMDKGRYAFGLLEAAVVALDAARPEASGRSCMAWQPSPSRARCSRSAFADRCCGPWSSTRCCGWTAACMLRCRGEPRHCRDRSGREAPPR